MYKNGDNIDARRFRQFNDAFENYNCVSQSGDNSQYNIDLAKDTYVNNDFTNTSNIAWITFKT
jgi:hypothetical protein